MAIKTGDKIPSATLKVMGSDAARKAKIGPISVSPPLGQTEGGFSL